MVKNQQRVNDIAKRISILIDALLRYPNEAENILNAHQDLIEPSLVNTIEQIAARLAEEGWDDAAYYLLDVSARLRIALHEASLAVIPDEYNYFLLRITWETAYSQANSQAVYPILQANLDKLDDNFAHILHHWAIPRLSQVERDKAQILAAAISGLSKLFLEFPLGNRGSNLEIAITGNEVATIVFTRAAFPEEWAEIQNNLGIVYLNRIRGNQADNIEVALCCFEAALQIRNRSALPERWATTKINQGVALSHQIRGDRSENIERAITAYTDALQVYTSDKFPEQWATAQHNLGSALNLAEDHEQAIAAFTNALQVRTRSMLPLQWADTQNCLGLSYWKRSQGNRAENIEIAIRAYKKALQVYTRPAYPERWADLQEHLGIAYYNRKKGNRTDNLERAISFFTNALQVFTRSGYPQKWAITQGDMGGAYFYRGQIDEAISCSRLALEITTPTADPVECFKSGRNLGNIASMAGRWKEAIEGYSFAIEAVETSRTWATSESRRQEILAKAIDVYQNMVQACINSGQLEKAIEYAERSRSKRLVDLMASNDLYQDSEIPPKVKELLQQFEDLQQQIDQERSQNQSGNNRELMGVGSRTQDRAAFQAYNEAIANLEAEKQQVWEQLRRLDPVLAGEIQVSAPDFAAMQMLIDQPTTAILSFYTTSNDTHIFVLRQHQITLHTCTGQGINSLQSWIFQNWLKLYIENENTWKSQISDFLSNLAQRLQINDLISQHLKGITELILVPHLALHQIPLAALPIENNQYLGDKFLIRYTPSCQILEFCQERGEITDQLTYGIVEDATEDLPFASFEGDRIAQLYNIPESDRLRGRSQCTKSRYRQLAKHVQVLHSCHHAQSRLDEPLESVLKLADETITLGELLTPGWRLLNLFDVFLSCCETGLGVTPVTDDILTLSTGFLCAGARSVVSTLWSVNDLATALFSIFYYQYRQQGKNRPEALQQAQIELRQLKKEELLNREDIKALSKQAEARRKEARSKRSQYKPGSADYLKWEGEYSKFARVTNQIYEVKNYQDNEPFSHPRFWGAFTCSGLR